MKSKVIAFLYNVRHNYPDPKDPRTFLEADFDDPQTISFIVKHLKKLGYSVVQIEADDKAYLTLYKLKNQIHLALNYSEGMWGNDREAQIPAMLEMLKIPYTGSTPLTQAIGLNKSKTKEILIANGIPTAEFQVFHSSKDILKNNLQFPLIVKPIAEGSSAGITNDSVVTSAKKLKEKVSFVIQSFKEPALVERYLVGREFSVALLGNPPEVLPIIEADHELLPKKYLPIDSLEVKWLYEEESQGAHLVCPAKMTNSLRNRIEQISLSTFKALDIKDLCRIDIRCDKDENPYVLEVNSPPGLIPPEVSVTSYFPLAARKKGLEYEALLQKIIEAAEERYGLR